MISDTVGFKSGRVTEVRPVFRSVAAVVPVVLKLPLVNRFTMGVLTFSSNQVETVDHVVVVSVLAPENASEMDFFRLLNLVVNGVVTFVPNQVSCGDHCVCESVFAPVNHLMILLANVENRVPSGDDTFVPNHPSTGFQSVSVSFLAPVKKERIFEPSVLNRVVRGVDTLFPNHVSVLPHAFCAPVAIEVNKSPTSTCIPVNVPMILLTIVWNQPGKVVHTVESLVARVARPSNRPSTI